METSEHVDNDLILNMSPNTEKLLQEGLVDADIIAVRDIVNDVNPSTLDKYSDSLLYRAYYIAKRKRTMSLNVIARELKISTKLLQYYFDKYPKLGLVIQMGVMDAVEELKTDVVDALYKASVGQTIKEEAVVTETEYDDEGIVLGTKQKISAVDKYIPPNIQAGLELLRKLDPSWNPKIDVNVSENKTLHVVEDVNVAVDYRKLSADALRELLQAQKDTNGNMQSMKLETGQSINTLYHKKDKPVSTKEETQSKKHREHKSTSIIKKHNAQVESVKKKAKKQALIAIKENKS